VQLAVDQKHKLIVEHEVTNAVTDQDQLAPMAERAKASLGVDKLEVVADMGYYDGAEVKKCEAQGITVYIPKPHTSANTKRGLFGKEQFHYDSGRDVYRCPAGQELTYRFGTVEKGRAISYYSTSACGGLCAQAPVNAQPGQSPDHSLGVQRRARADAKASPSTAGQDAETQATGGASVWDDEALDGARLLSDAAPRESGNGDEPDGAGLQSQTGVESHRHPEDDCSARIAERLGP